MMSNKNKIKENKVREIKFRALSNNTKDWVYGSLIKGNNYDFIITKEDYDNVVAGFDTLVCQCHPIEKDSKTISQFTGLYDKNGKEIYEGDVVRFNNQTGKVVYEYGSFGVGIEEGIDYDRLEDFTRENLDNTFEGTFNDNFLPLFEIYYNLNNIDGYIDEIEVIGNIYDNPELLGEQQ